MNPIKQGKQREVGPDLGASIDGPSVDAIRNQLISSTQKEKDYIKAAIEALLSGDSTAARLSRKQADAARAGSSSKSDSDSARTIELDDPVFAQPASETGSQSEMSQQSSQFSTENNSTAEALDAIERHLNDLIKVLSEGYIVGGIRKMGTALQFPFRSKDTQRREGRKEFKRVITDMEAPIRGLKERLENLGNDNAIPRQHREKLIDLYAKIRTELSKGAVEEWVTYRGETNWQDTSLYKKAQALEKKITLWRVTAIEALERPTQTDGQSSSN